MRCGHCENLLPPSETGDSLCPHCALRSAVALGRPIVDASAPDGVANYEPLYELGRGSMGVVWLARDIALDRLVALKRIESSTDQRFGVRLLREGRVVAQLKHPHIVTIYALGETEGGAFLAMEFLEGGDLQHRLEERLPAPREAAELVAKIADALAHAHDSGLLHRDVKPSNILFDAAGEPRLADFGLAAPLLGAGDLTAPGQILGTPAFLAPELLKGAERASPQSDIYGTGAVLYACLTGRPPFVGQTTAAILAQIDTANPPPPRHLKQTIPRDLETICLACLEKTPSRRYASAGALRDDLRRFLAGKPIQARPRGRVAKIIRRCRSKPALAAIGLGLVVGGSLLTQQIAVRFSATAGNASGTPESEAAQLAAKARARYERPGFMRDDLSLAEDFARRATELDPGSATAWGARAGAHAAWLFRGWDRSLERQQETQSFAQRALSLDENEPEALVALGFAFYTQGAADRAEAVFRRGTVAHPNHVRLARALGFTRYRQRRDEEGRTVLLEIAQRFPRDPLAHYDVALSYGDYGADGRDPANLATALKHLDIAIGLQPFSTALELKAALIGGWRGDLTTLRAVLDELQKLPVSERSGDRAVYISMWAGVLERRADRVAAAAAQTARTYFDDGSVPLRPKAWSLALAHQVAGKENRARADWQEAESMLRQRVREDPTNLVYQAELAITLAWLGHRDEAEHLIAPIEAVWREEPAFVRSRLLALYYGALGNAAKAASYLPRVIDCSPFSSREVMPLDPWWDKLRGQPEFEALLTERATPP